MKDQKKSAKNDDYFDYKQNQNGKKSKMKFDRRSARQVKAEESEYEEGMLSGNFDDDFDYKK